MLPEILQYVDENLAKILVYGVIFLISVFAAAVGLSGGAQ